jgi:autotransporter-associated beta strand protein
MSGLSTAEIYSGGAIVNTAGQNITIGQDIQSAGGLGGLNTPVVLASAGSGYVGAPVVTITGGGGFGASAVASVNAATGQVTGISITSAGAGYTSPPVFTLTGGGGTGANVSSYTPTSNAPDGGFAKLGVGTLTLGGNNTWTGTTNVSGGALVIAGDGSIPSGGAVLVGPGANLVLPDQYTASSIASLNINGSVIVHGGSLEGISAQIAQDYDHGNWNGSAGISSTSAAGDTTHLTALGVILNDNGAGTATPVYAATFEGQPVSDSDVLIKCTYYGDANLDGRVDGSDYSLIDNGYANHLTGWYNGDFNYDGVVDGSDYALVDNAFNNQGAYVAAQLGPATAQVNASAVPEPASFALPGTIYVAILTRRHRSKSRRQTEGI